MAKVGIYKITSPTGKVYIGQSTDIVDRWRHYNRLDCKRQRYLFNSFKKYGVENHSFEIVRLIDNYTPTTQNLLNQLEIVWWVINASRSEMLTLREPGGSKGKHSEETKKLLSEAHKGKTLSSETKRKISSSLIGKVVSAETRSKISRIHKNKTVSKDARKKISNALKGSNNFNFGKPKSEVTRKKLSEAGKGKQNGAKLSADDVSKMWEMFDQGYRVFQVKQHFPTVTRSAINSIKNGYSWNEITGLSKRT